MSAVGFLVLAGSAAVLRWQVTIRWPALGTLILNVAGALALGVLAARQSEAMTVLGTAGLGALTTVSGLASNAAIIGAGRPGRAAAFLAANVVLGVGAAWAGLRWG
ncbi:MAG: CrcB family protein [Actinomycetota bacterium]|jgi:fluoride exporter|nr:CrcB family protein [Actinomycetota bacterium]